MNKQEIEELIHIYIPKLVNEEKSRWKRAENLRRDFVFDFSLEKIGAMKLDDYAIGKGSDNQSFCYRLEREMDDLGRILGATAFKFGVYYGRTKSDPVEKYRHAKKWGGDVDEAFKSTRKEILSLLKAAINKNQKTLEQNRLSPMLKGKLLYVYFPEEFAPIYSGDHLRYFVAELNLRANPKSTVEMQRTLMAFRNKFPVLMKYSSLVFMRFLYEVFPNAKTPSTSRNELSNLPLLNDAISGAIFIEQIPSSTVSKPVEKSTAKKVDYERKQRQLKRIGDRGEKIVLNMEEKRLIDSGRPDLAKRIKHISEESDREGYDILSFDQDGSPRHIEVKATISENLGSGFYISNNELEKSKILSNYYIYFVFSVTSENPKILPISEPTFSSDLFILDPIVYWGKFNHRII